MSLTKSPIGLRTCTGCGAHHSIPWYRIDKAWWCGTCTRVDTSTHPVPGDLLMVRDADNACHVIAPGEGEPVHMLCGCLLWTDGLGERYSRPVEERNAKQLEHYTGEHTPRADVEATQRTWRDLHDSEVYAWPCQRCIAVALARMAEDPDLLARHEPGRADQPTLFGAAP